MQKEVKYSELIRHSTTKGIPVQWVEFDDRWLLSVVDGNLALYVELDKSSSDATDFVTNYKTTTSVRVVTTIPALPNPESYRFRGNATNWTTCTPGQTNLDVTPSATEVRYVDGGVIVCKDSNPGDYCTFQVVHPQAGVVEEYISKWFVLPGSGYTEVTVYPARIPAGMILRVVYNNVGQTNAQVGINYRLHK